MFTGLIQDVGRIVRISSTGEDAHIEIATGLDSFVLGESISVNGACLSVTVFQSNTFTVFASKETLQITGMGTLRPNTPVNLERAVKVGDALGGHIVTGHVDTQVNLLSRRPQGSAEQFELSLPEDSKLKQQIAPKGSITLNGVSLTVNTVTDRTFNVMIIPITLAHTTLGETPQGASINIETDVLAKYVSRMLAPPEEPKSSVDMELLIRNGFVR